MYLWDCERNMWWKPRRQGYTSDLGEAGLYDPHAIVDICRNNYNPKEATIPVGIMAAEHWQANFKRG